MFFLAKYMLDINLIRESPELVKNNLKNRNEAEKAVWVDDIIKLDGLWRKNNTKIETLRHERNKLTDEIRHLKSEGKETKKLIKEAASIPDQIKDLEDENLKHKEKISYYVERIPNLLDKGVPVGKDSNDNKELKVWGKKPKFDFKPRPHWEVGEKLGILDLDRAAKLSGHGFYVLKGLGAKLQRALVNFMIDFHVKDGFTEINPPQLVTQKTAFGTGNLPKFEEDLYKTTNGFYLVPTAEVPVTNLHADEVLEEKELPKNYVAFTECYRTEAGHHGTETRGIFRLHQFEKVEMVKIVKPETSWNEHESMTRRAEKILEMLELPYRRIILCSGDSGFSSAKTYDLEVWAEASERYLEVSSCSNCTDFQARRMKTKYRTKEGNKFVHTLNGSGLALPRLMIVILENYQQRDGSLKIPKVLVPYVGASVIKNG